MKHHQCHYLYDSIQQQKILISPSVQQISDCVLAATLLIGHKLGINLFTS